MQFRSSLTGSCSNSVDISNGNRESENGALSSAAGCSPESGIRSGRAQTPRLAYDPVARVGGPCGSCSQQFRRPQKDVVGASVRCATLIAHSAGARWQ